MKITAMRAFSGRSIHSHYPVIQLDLDLAEGDGLLTSEIDGFVERLLALVPSLREHHCSRGHPGGFVERLREGTLMGHVLEHLILELQALVGSEVIYGKTRRLCASEYRVVVECDCAAVAQAAAQEAVDILNALIAGHQVDIAESIQLIDRIKREADLGPSTRAIVEAAERRGIPAMRLDEGSLVQLGYGCRQKRIQATITAETGCIGVDTAGDKVLCKRLLDECGVPVPEGYLARTAEELIEAARRLDGPVAIKPRRGNQGNGVSLNLSDEEAWRRAFQLARQVDDEVIVERFIPGQQYRVLIVGDEVVAASHRIPPTVTGDGIRSIRELVEKINEDPERGEGHEAPLTHIPLDDLTVLTLQRQGFTVESVPDDGQVVKARDGANLSAGGTAVDVTESVHPSAANMCRRAARIVGLDVAGVDLVTGDISEPVGDGNGGFGGAVVEVNAAPGLRMHQYPSSGRKRDAAQAIVDQLFPQCGARGRIPIIAVTGTNGKTTTVRLLEHILRSAGYATGITTTDGIYISGERAVTGDTTGPWSARVVLRDPQVEFAVLETARGGIIRGGLAFDYCDVAVVTNISSDHLGQDGVETLGDLVDVKSLVVEAVPRWGKAVLNADDPRVMEMRSSCLGEAVLFSVQDNNLSLMKHLNAGGSGVFVTDNRLLWARGRKVATLANLSDAPLTMGGILEHNVQNLAAGAAAALASGVSPTTIGKAVSTFDPGDKNPGRFEVYRLGDRHVVIDYGHNAAGYAVTLQALRSLPGERWAGVIGVPGNRRDDDIRATGRIAARYLDRMIIKEDQENPGRRAGEVAGHLLSGILQSSHPEEKVQIILDEQDAARRALEGLPDGGSLVIFYEDYQGVTGVLREWAREEELSVQRLTHPGEHPDSEGEDWAAGMTPP